MRLLQDWSTLPGNGTTPFVQSSSGWLDLSGFGDVCFWLEVRSVAKPGAGEVLLTYETAPATDNSLFQPLASVTLAVSTSPVVTSIRLGSNPTVPLARYVRWRLEGTAAGDWSTTLRIHVAPGSGTSASAIINPASLALTGWWRASYGGSPWAGTASAGGSGSNALSEATNPPAVGTALNGLTPAEFDGTNDELSAATGISTALPPTAFTVIALFFADTAAADAGASTYYENPALVCDATEGRLAVTFSTAGVRAGTFDGSNFDSAAATCSTGAWHMAFVTYDGSNLIVAVDAGSPVSVARSSTVYSPGADVMVVGENYDGSAYFDGRLAELMTAAYAMSSGDRANIRAYFNARYALSL